MRKPSGFISRNCLYSLSLTTSRTTETFPYHLKRMRQIRDQSLLPDAEDHRSIQQSVMRFPCWKPIHHIQQKQNQHRRGRADCKLITIGHCVAGLTRTKYLPTTNCLHVDRKECPHVASEIDVRLRGVSTRITVGVVGREGGGRENVL